MPGRKRKTILFIGSTLSANEWQAGRPRCSWSNRSRLPATLLKTPFHRVNSNPTAVFLALKKLVTSPPHGSLPNQDHGGFNLKNGIEGSQPRCLAVGCPYSDWNRQTSRVECLRSDTIKPFKRPSPDPVHAWNVPRPTMCHLPEHDKCFSTRYRGLTKVQGISTTNSQWGSVRLLFFTLDVLVFFWPRETDENDDTNRTHRRNPRRFFSFRSQHLLRRTTRTDTVLFTLQAQRFVGYSE